jgi:tetratricopeptide (TPR) repeat protein
MNKGNALWALGRFEEAAHVYALAKRQRNLPSILQSVLFYNLAGTLVLLGRCEEALPYYQEISAQEAERAWACYAQAEVLTLLGRDEEALAAYLQVDQGTASVDRGVTRRSLSCRFACPLGYERQGQGVFAYGWQVGSGKPQWPQSEEQTAPPSC